MSITFEKKCERFLREGRIVKGTRGGGLKSCILLMMVINLLNIDCYFVKGL